MFIHSLQKVVNNQLESVSKLLELDYTIDKLIEYLTSNPNVNLIVAGVGKSGHIGKKISSTLLSTGTRSFFLHPTEALHGDLGMIQENDAVLLISNSGESEEILLLLKKLKNRKVVTVGLTGNSESTLAKNTNYQLLYSVIKESCPLNLAPMDSCTCQLILGDCLAHNLMTEKKFSQRNFAENHPGGSLGKKLLSKARDLIEGESIIVIDSNLSNSKLNFQTVLLSLSKGKLGLIAIYGKNREIGIFTAGDLQRMIEKKYQDIFDSNIYDFINFEPITIDSEANYDEVLEVFKANNINNLLVIDKRNNKVIGVINSKKIL